MSKERELLKEIMSYFAKGDITIRKFENSSDVAETLHTAQEILTQPEPFMFKDRKLTGSLIAHDEMYQRGYARAEFDLKREPFEPEQTEQEPVAWKVIDRTNGEYMFYRVKPMERSYKYNVVIPLYTAPPKREPLSDDGRQRLSIWESI